MTVRQVMSLQKSVQFIGEKSPAVEFGYTFSCANRLRALRSTAQADEPLLLLDGKVRPQYQHMLSDSPFDLAVCFDEFIYLLQQLFAGALGIFEKGKQISSFG